MQEKRTVLYIKLLFDSQNQNVLLSFARTMHSEIINVTFLHYFIVTYSKLYKVERVNNLFTNESNLGNLNNMVKKTIIVKGFTQKEDGTISISENLNVIFFN